MLKFLIAGLRFGLRTIDDGAKPTAHHLELVLRR
jgi:hypothetical protein